MAITLTYFVHGTTTDNEQDLATGWQPGELSQIGRTQAQQLGEQVVSKTFDVVFCSDLQRAIDSARLGFGDKYRIIQDPRLRECDYGRFTGASAADFKDRLTDYIDHPFPPGAEFKGESYRDVERRLREFVDSLRDHYAGQHVAVVGHQGPQLALDVILGGKTWPQAIETDWRRTKAWRPGWDYRID